MKQFNLEEWLQDKSRTICTRDGNIAEIIYTNGKGRFPVIVIDPYEEETEPWQVTKNGKFFCNGDDDKLDLFFANEEEELTEFEKAVEKTIPYKIPIDMLKNTSQQLLELARKEFLKGLPEWKKITKKEQNYLVYGYLSHDGYYLNLQELREKLPKEK